MDLWNKFIFSVRSIGLGNTLMTIYASLQRDWIEYRYRSSKMTDAATSLQPGQLIEMRPITSGAVFQFDHSELEIHFLTSDLVRITWTPGTLPVPYAIEETIWDPVDVSLEEKESKWSLNTGSIRLHIHDDGHLKYFDNQDRLLREELPPLRNGSAWQQHTNLRDAETFYGLGERATGFNLRGGSYKLWNHESSGAYGSDSDPLYVSIPVYHAIHPEGSYLVFYENSYLGRILFENNPSEVSHSQVRFEGGALRSYFTPGSPVRTLMRYTQLTGRAPLPPRWSLGYHQCRWGYKSEADIREVVQGFEARGLPLSAIHLDIDYMNGFRVFTVDRQRYPDLTKLSSDMQAKGVQMVTILDPGVKVDPDYSVYRDGLENEYFVNLPNGKPVRGRVWPGWCVFPDFTSSKIREWWGSHYSKLLNAGIRGFWNDMNEPSAFAAWGLPTLPSVAQYTFEGRGGNHLEANNLFGLLNNQAGFEGIKAHRPEQRPWILSRSGWAGMQRYAWNWTGDVETSWDAMQTTLRIMLNLGLSGVPYSGSDIGGFGGHPDAELFTRWFQMAAFNPFFRGHSAVSVPRREPWIYGDETTEIICRYLNFRMQLIPYLYTLAWQASQTGHPLMRPLFWLEEPELIDIEDAFLLGDTLLIAPVMEPGAASREVRIPEGVWVDLWEKKVYTGPANTTVETPIDRIPVFVRGGKVLPLADANTLHLHIYASLPENGLSLTSPLYSDDGDGYGDWRVDRFQTSWDGDVFEVTRSVEGSYPFPYKQVVVSVHGLPVTSVTVDGEAMQMDENQVVTGLFDHLRIRSSAE